jgi:hypothetical protein
MTERRAVVRSYQRLFRPDRRIYSIDGRTIPVPGGVPLRWLAHAVAVAIVGLVLAGLHPVVIVAAGLGSYRWASRIGSRRDAAALGVLAAGTMPTAGLVIGAVDWPMRLVILPAVAATALTQPSGDGRSAWRFLVSYVRTRIAGRRWLGLPLPAAGSPRRLELAVAVRPDHRRPVLGRARVTGPCRVALAEPVLVHRRRGITHVRPVAGERRRRGVMVDSLAVGDGERLEVHP